MYPLKERIRRVGLLAYGSLLALTGIMGSLQKQFS
jgi:hypothetical protein